jgi:adenine/guanine phosphoribosyltransferase-like PRPP-binding protein
MADLASIWTDASRDLIPHMKNFDAIVVPGDHHGIAIGGAVAAALGRPLMIVCTSPHECVISHITCIGDVRPDMRFLYVDDFPKFGASRARVFAYMNQSGPAPVVAEYYAAERTYTPVKGLPDDLFRPYVS